MPATPEKFPIGLVRWVPETRLLVDRHREDQAGEILLRLLLGELARFCLAAYEQGDTDLAARTLRYVDGELFEGDAELEEAICVSFVEAIGPWDEGMRRFIETWPGCLREEAERQMHAR